MSSELKKIVSQENVRAIHSSRLGHNVSRATGADMIPDLMIHDLDAVSQILGGNFNFGGVVGGNLHSPNLDHEFSAKPVSCNDSIATLIASRISQIKYRMLNVSCSACYIGGDFSRREIKINRCVAGSFISDLQDVTYKQDYLVERVFALNVKLLMAEHNDIIESILDSKEPFVTANHGVEALRLAKKIQSLCKR